MDSQLTQQHAFDYLRYLYFGGNKDIYTAATHRAYLDFNRTMHAFAIHVKRHQVQSHAERMLETELRSMLSSAIIDRKGFDEWHKNCCDKLIAAFDDYKFYYGQAQKWINMSLKYLFVLDRSVTNGRYQHFHVPIDNIILERIKNKRPPGFSTAWSRISDYNEYIQFQNWFRNEFPGIPMDNEFELWMK